MIINKASIQAVFTNIKTTFTKAFNDTTVVWPKIAMRIASTGSNNDYSWLSRFPKMRRWVGEKHIKNLKANRYVIYNDDFESTIEVNRNDFKDDNLGQVAIQAQSAGKSAKEWPDSLVFEALNKGGTQLCFDGQYFFDTDHPVGETLVSNRLSLPFDISSLAAAEASYGVASALMKNYKDEEGVPLGTKPNVFVAGPAIATKARAFFNSDKFQDGAANPYYKECEVVESALVDSPTAWYVMDMSQPIAPFIFQEREAPYMVSQTDMESDSVFLRKKYLFGVEARGEGGYGFWQMCVQGNQ